MSHSQASRSVTIRSNRPAATRQSRQASEGRKCRATAGAPPGQSSGFSIDEATSARAPSSLPRREAAIGRPSSVAPAPSAAA